MKIIKPAPPWKAETTCPHCFAGLEIEAEDIKYGKFMSGWSETERDYYYICISCSSYVREHPRDGNYSFSIEIPYPIRKKAIDARTD